MDLFKLQSGKGPVLVNVPHAGTFLPPNIAARLRPPAQALPDTDWFVDELYAGVGQVGAGLMVATHSRYVIDLNRPPDDHALYQAQGTSLIPSTSFAGEPLYVEGGLPDEQELASRVSRYWTPYHVALEAELCRIREQHGYAILLDGHSILSRVPMLFEGRLPDLNLGSFRGASAAAQLVSSAMAYLATANQWTSVLDGRFQGGYITRNYGRPQESMHALQLEMAQAMYMQEAPVKRRPQDMQRLNTFLVGLVSSLAKWRPEPPG